MTSRWLYNIATAIAYGLGKAGFLGEKGNGGENGADRNPARRLGFFSSRVQSNLGFALDRPHQIPGHKSKAL